MTARRMGYISRLRRHWEQGTMSDVFRRVLGIAPPHLRVRWYGANSERDAQRALARWARILVADTQSPAAWVLAIGNDGMFHAGLLARLSGVPHRSMTPAQALSISGADAAGLAGVICGFPDARRMTAVARAIAVHPVLSSVPFEYAAGAFGERQTFERLDEYRGTFFVSPVLNDDPGPYAIYEESLLHFEQKCGLRDFLDLYQLLKAVVQNDTPGDVVEFGSYRGHSGWLMARTLDALGSGKRVFLFDAFEEFPPEPYGVDYFWNRTHHVNYEEVQAKFSGLPQVTLVKGDFTRTLATSGVGQIALAYIDCDSYRATRHLIREILPEMLSVGGVLVVEDYGHPALLGSRAAVHEELDEAHGCLRYFSQFSGLYITVKLAQSGAGDGAADKLSGVF